jgi:hypothetical protein
LTTTYFDVSLLSGATYEWHLEASTGAISPDPRLGEPEKYWTFDTQ